MIEEPPMTPPPAPSGRKGLSPLAWAGIGCGSLLVIVIVAAAFVVGTVFRKAKSVLENPVSIVEFIIDQNPDLEVITNDEVGETMTIRNTSDGTEVTISYQDIRDGKLEILTGDGQIQIDATDGDGSVTINTPDGNTRIGASADLSKLPGWVPTYPGATASMTTSTVSGSGAIKGQYVASTPDDQATVAAHLKQQLATAGFTVDESAPAGGTLFEARSASPQRTATVAVGSTAQGSTVSVTYAEQ